MPYKTITHKNGFTEIISYNLTPAEEIEQMTRMSGVKLFPSVNARRKKQSEIAESNSKSQVDHSEQAKDKK